MPNKTTPAGRELVDALNEVLDDVSGRRTLPGRSLRVPDDIDVRAIRKKTGMSQKAFSDQFGIDYRLLQDWEQKHRRPAGHARAYLLVIDREPKAVERALA